MLVCFCVFIPFHWFLEFPYSCIKCSNVILYEVRRVSNRNNLNYGTVVHRGSEVFPPNKGFLVGPLTKYGHVGGTLLNPYVL